eukprot:XP_001704646.1 Hypothetical protein GL50803_26533 [Giardia lamblia ATCC 50803]
MVIASFARFIQHVSEMSASLSMGELLSPAQTINLSSFSIQLMYSLESASVDIQTGFTVLGSAQMAV